uniref:Uncharacterized protein n=1 Tax=Solanum lycopersicum TaxID=4081 RepID=A0A3Q7FNW6_SOLLC
MGTILLEKMKRSRRCVPHHCHVDADENFEDKNIDLPAIEQLIRLKIHLQYS